MRELRELDSRVFSVSTTTAVEVFCARLTSLVMKGTERLARFFRRRLMGGAGFSSFSWRAPGPRSKTTSPKPPERVSSTTAR
jgi:hypothetical protein